MPLPIMRSARILLRPWTLEDVDSLYALWTAPEVRRYLWDDTVITLDVVEQTVESHLLTASEYGVGYWALHIPPPESAAGAPIAGFCGFRLMDNGPDIELMYGLRSDYWGKGLATEACLAAVEYLWCATGYQKVYARTDPSNNGSVRVMQRLGMTHESTTESTITYLLRRPRDGKIPLGSKPS
jgi:[ribosomal protein S5]-alanine N-acetyltransferase